jgi:tetratricopeptide (TPR) repeat protein
MSEDNKTVYDHINLLDPVYPINSEEKRFIEEMKNSVPFPKEHEETFKKALEGNEKAITEMQFKALGYNKKDRNDVLSTIVIGLASIGNSWAALELGRARKQKGNLDGAKQIFNKIIERLSDSKNPTELFIMERAEQETSEKKENDMYSAVMNAFSKTR